MAPRSKDLSFHMQLSYAMPRLWPAVQADQRALPGSVELGDRCKAAVADRPGGLCEDLPARRSWLPTLRCPRDLLLHRHSQRRGRGLSSNLVHGVRKVLEVRDSQSPRVSGLDDLVNMIKLGDHPTTELM